MSACVHFPIALSCLAALNVAPAANQGCSGSGADRCSARGDNDWLPDDGTVLERLGSAYGTCDFDRIDAEDLTVTGFRKIYKEKRPVVIANWPFVGSMAERWRKAPFLATHGKTRVILRKDNAAGDTSHQVLLEEAVVDWARSGDFVLDFAQRTGQEVVSPELPAVQDSWLGAVFHLDNISMTLSLGPSGIGAPIHHHPESWLLLLHGEKHWFFYPPGGIDDLPRSVIDMLGAPYTLPQDVLPELMALDGRSRPLQCTQRPGEVMYFPSLWDHGTINVGEAIGFAVQHGLKLDESTMMEYYAGLGHASGQSRYCKLAVDASLDYSNENLQKMYDFVHPRFWNAPLTDTYMNTVLHLYRSMNESGIADAFVERLKEQYLEMPRMHKLKEKLQKVITKHKQLAAKKGSSS